MKVFACIFYIVMHTWLTNKQVVEVCFEHTICNYGIFYGNAVYKSENELFGIEK
jgi:hypothetical protein